MYVLTAHILCIYRLIFERFGNVGFFMKQLFGLGGIISDGLKIYFIEVIEFWKQSKCRFLVTTDTYPQLREYDPTIPGGPLYYDKINNEFYHLKTIKRNNGSINKNTVEIMKDPNSHPIWHYENHYISISDCIYPKRGVDSVIILSKLQIYHVNYTQTSQVAIFRSRAYMKRGL